MRPALAIFGHTAIRSAGRLRRPLSILTRSALSSHITRRKRLVHPGIATTRLLASVLLHTVGGDEITEAEEDIMSTVAEIQNRIQTPATAAVQPVRPVPPVTPFPQSGQSGRSFQRELIAATNRIDQSRNVSAPINGKRVLLASANDVQASRGLASPTPNRASALRRPTPSVQALNTPRSTNTQSIMPEFKPLPLSGADRPESPQSKTPTGPTHSPATGPSRMPPATPSDMMQQMVEDYRDYERMMSNREVAPQQPSSEQPRAEALRPTPGEPPSQETVQPFAQAISESEKSPVPQAEPPAESQQPAPVDPRAFIPTPFPRNAQIAQVTPFPEPASEPTSQKQGAYSSYKDDQLLANAGGDNYVRDGDTVRVDPSYDHSKFTARVGKDLGDAGQNLKDAAGDLSVGSTTHSRTPSGDVESQRRPGLFGTLGNFAKDVVSGATLGFYRPSGDPEPSGFSRVFYPFKKILLDGVVKDLAIGVPASFLRAGEHTTLAAMNAAETVPDATIGNIGAGRKLTTAAFDNAQVGVSYMADVMPTGDAWARVGASGRGGDWGIPVLTNLRAPEYDTTDPRFASVRNTGFRKGIETVGTLGIGAALAAASAPAAALGASTAMRTGSEMRAREQNEQMASPSIATGRQPLSGLSLGRATSQTPSPFGSPQPAPQSLNQQGPSTASSRPKLWESPSNL